MKKLIKFYLICVVLVFMNFNMYVSVDAGNYENSIAPFYEQGPKKGAPIK